MAQVDTLLKMLTDHGGDELVLVPDEVPRLLRNGERLRLFFPTLDASMMGLVLGDLLTEERRERIDAGERLEVRHEVEGLGHFDAEFRDGIVRFRREQAALKETRSDRTADEAATAPHMASDTRDVSHQLSALLEHAASVGASDLHLSDG